MLVLVKATLLLLCVADISSAPSAKDPRQRALEQDSRLNCSDGSACQTEECISSAARIIEALDPNIDPCDNFYQFACGGWLKNVIIPPHRPAIVIFSDIDKHLAAARNLLKEAPKPTELSSIRKAKDLYASCIQYATNQDDNRSLVDIITTRFGSWPKTREWNKSEFDLGDYLSKASRLLIYPLFKFIVDVYKVWNEKAKLTGFYVLTVQRPTFGLPDLMYEQEDSIAVKAYRDNIAQHLLLYGGQDNAKDAEDIYEVEKTLAMLLLKPGAEQERTYTLEELQQKFGDLLDWTNFVTSLASSPEVGITDIKPFEDVVVTVPVYLANITDYFSKLPSRIQANYIIWRVLDSLDKMLVRQDNILKFILKKSVRGVTADPSAEESCVLYLSIEFSLVLHRLLYSDIFPPEEIKEIHNLLQEVQQEFNEVVKEHAWVDEQTANFIKKKNAALETILISYQQAMDDNLLEAYYANVTYSNISSFVDKDLVNREQGFLKNLRLLRKPFQLVAENLPIEVVAQNTFVENRLEFSALLFYPPVYSRNVPQSINYGGLGVIFGHEIVHAFDSTAFNRNEEGAVGDWWSKETIAIFQERQQCMIDQYSNFFSETAQLYVDGDLTLSENIADNGGLKLAYRAYRKFVEARGSEEAPLPGIKYSHDQLFFISFAQLWCSVETREFATNSINADPHTPTEFRVIGTYQNSRDFAHVFNCPAGSNMNPQTKCEIW